MKCKYCGKNFRAKNALFCSEKCNKYYSHELKEKNNSKYSRVTVTMQDDIIKNLRDIQSNLILNSIGNVSFSQVVNIVLQEGIKAKKMLIKKIWNNYFINFDKKSDGISDKLTSVGIYKIFFLIFYLTASIFIPNLVGESQWGWTLIETKIKNNLRWTWLVLIWL